MRKTEKSNSHPLGREATPMIKNQNKTIAALAAIPRACERRHYRRPCSGHFFSQKLPRILGRQFSRFRWRVGPPSRMVRGKMPFCLTSRESPIYLVPFRKSGFLTKKTIFRGLPLAINVKNGYFWHFQKCKKLKNFCIFEVSILKTCEANALTVLLPLFSHFLSFLAVFKDDVEKLTVWLWYVFQKIEKLDFWKINFFSIFSRKNQEFFFVFFSKNRGFCKFSIGVRSFSRKLTMSRR